MRARRLSAVPAAVLLFLSVACQRDPVAVATPLTVRPPDAETRATNQAISQGSIIDLGTLGGRYSEAKAVNASGDVVGSAGLPGPVDVRRAFLWRNGVMTNLGTLGIGRNTVANYSFAFGINDAGQIVGESTTPLTYYHHAVVWWNGSIIDLGAKGPSSYSSAYAINNAGDAVGSGDVASGANHALLWRGGQIIDLFTLGGSTSNAYGINNAGQVVGASTTTGDLATHAFLWQSGVMTDLGTLGGLSSYANGINDAGQVVGYSYTTAGTAHAFRWDATSGMTDLGAISGQTISQAFGVSPTGMIVGQSFSNGVPTRAVVWEADVISILDNLSNATSSSANAVNSSGMAVGVSDLTNGESHATVWDLNLSPTANAGGPYTGSEGSPVTYTGAASTDPDHDALAYDWDFGDASPHATGVAPTHAYVDNGTYTITLIISDGALSDTASTTAIVTNAPPAPDAGADASIIAKVATVFVPSFSDAGVLDTPWTYQVLWGDGQLTAIMSATVQGAQAPLSHAYALPGTYIRRLTVTDRDGGTAVDDATITVALNPPPVAKVNGPYTGNEGTAVAMSSAGSTDPNGGTLTFSWSFGDGTTSTAVNPSHVYADNGTYTVTLVAKETSGNTNSATTTATIANVAPTATFSAPSTITEGATATVALKYGTDKGAADRPTLEYAFDCGQGAGFTPWSKTVKSVICPALPDQRPPLTVRGEIRDKDGGLTTYQKSMTVTNAAPVVAFSATSGTTFPKGQSLSVQGSFTDKGVLDQPWTYIVTWGDAKTPVSGTVSAQGAVPAASHVYATAGTFKAYLTVKDKDGKSGVSVKVTVTVTP